ncbi:unnamed protein product [Mortierella alpina]
MARINLNSPVKQPRRPFPPSSSYDTTRNLPNPFHDNSSSSTTTSTTHTTRVAAVTKAMSTSSAPLESDTIPAPYSPTSHSRPTKSITDFDRRDHDEVDRSDSKSITAYYRNSSTTDDPSDAHLRDYSPEPDNPLIYLTPNQRQAAVENLEIETMDRIQKLRASISVLTNSLKFRSEAEINRLPAAIRAMTVEEYWLTYNGNAKEYLERQAMNKTLANTTFLHALGMTEPKRRRDHPGSSDSLWQQQQKNKDASQGSGGGPSSSSNSSSNNMRSLQQSVRHRPYPVDVPSLARSTAKPFVERPRQNTRE